MKEQIDFALLQELLTRRKQIERAEVSRLLAFENDDEEDRETLDGLMLLVPESGCRKYLSLETLSRKRVQAYIDQKATELVASTTKPRFTPTQLMAYERLHEILNTDIPPEHLLGADHPNIVGELESLTLTKGPSGVKLTDPESSVGKGLIVDFSLVEAPLVVPPHQTGKALVDFCVRAEIFDLSRLLTEGAYNMKDIGHPSNMVTKSADATAKTVLPENYGIQKKLVVANPQSKPELSAGIKLVGRPTKSDEWKTFSSEAIEELIQTSLGHIQSSYFREDEGAQSWRFYEKPPWGLAFLSCACSAVCVFSVEMVGVLLFSIYGGGCSVGSEVYNEHIKLLDNVAEQQPVVDLKNVKLIECQTAGKKVQWTAQALDGYFYKVIRYDLFRKDCCPEHGVSRGDNWRRLFGVYEKYTSLCDSEDMPHALIPATLLYGEFQTAVRMPFIEGFTVMPDEQATEEDCADLCRALVFLAKHGLIYTDFRPQNVIRSHPDGRIRLIDYDDMKAVRRSALQEEYEKILAKVDSDSGFGAWVRNAISAALSATTNVPKTHTTGTPAACSVPAISDASSNNRSDIVQSLPLN
jgi:hypothetical protein